MFNWVTTATLATAIAILCAPAVTAQQPIIGVASVIDRDTIEIRGERIRLNG